MPGPARTDGAHEDEVAHPDHEVRHLPVPLAEARPIDRAQAAPLPAPLVAATGGFLVGFATLLLARVLRRRRAPKGIARFRGKRGSGLEVTGSRSFLVDVHLLKR